MVTSFADEPAVAVKANYFSRRRFGLAQTESGLGTETGDCQVKFNILD
jgi:hypothetical protein